MHSGIQITNTPEVTNLPRDDVDNEINWYKVAEDIEELYNILEEKPTKGVYPPNTKRALTIYDHLEVLEDL